jgi:hypothetical protein
MKKVLSSMVMVLILSISFFAYASPETCVPVVASRGQEQDLWCWAACSQMILVYYGVTETQSAIAKYACEQHGTAWCTDCSICEQDNPDCCNHTNNLYGSGGVGDILDNFGAIGSNHSFTYLTVNEIFSELCQPHCRPFIMAWTWAGGGGHDLVGRGIHDGLYPLIYYIDPLPVGSPGTYHVALYDYVVESDTSPGAHTWTETLRLTQPDNCPPLTPTLTEWGLVILVALIVFSTWVVLRRRKVIGVR